MNHRCFAALQANAWEKLAWQAGVGAWMALCYYPPQIWPLFPAREVPLLPGEFVMPFSPGWSSVYQSVFLLHTAVIWGPAELSRVKTYCLALATAFSVGACFFWLWPMSLPRPQTDSGLYRALIAAVDGPRNAFPSLHAVMATFGVWWLKPGMSLGAVILLALWWLGMLYSTLATGQHRFLDLLGGLGLSVILIGLFDHNRSTP